jgi:hypothetical protein
MLGASQVYSQASLLAEKLLGLSIGKSQIFRISDHVGQALEQDMLTEIELTAPVTEAEKVYVGVDGSFISTTEGWQEVKLSRMFVSEPTQERESAQSSVYSAHLGHYQGFIPKFEATVSVFESCGEKKVFLTDGVSWLHEYLKEKHPAATHILDLYHVKEKIACYAQQRFKQQPQQAKIWYEQQCEYLLKEGPERLIQHMQQDSTVQELKPYSSPLWTYLTHNKERMNYPDYIRRQLCVGSGMIESAHRHVIQVRMKRAGQRWTIKGAQNMLNLRVMMASNQWNIVSQYLKAA